VSEPLTHHERVVLDRLAAHESAADPGFARRLRRHPGHGAAVPWLVGAALAVVGVALLLVPGLWVLAAVATLVLVVVPSVLVAWALRQGDLPPG
jgi:Flp pilus assembly protein TadB